MFLSLRTYFVTLPFLVFSSTLLGGHAGAHPPKNDSLKHRILKTREKPSFNPGDTLHINLLNDLAYSMRFYRADSLFLLSQEALAHSRNTNYTKGECLALLGLGEYYSDKGEHEKSVRHFKHAHKIAMELQGTELLLNIKNSLCHQYDVMGSYAKAISGYLEGIEIAKRENDQYMLGVFHENIGGLYDSQRDYSQALEFYKIALEIGEELNDKDFQAPTMSNIASTYAELGQLEYAMYHINQSISILEKNESVDWLAY
ncbi:MAG: tetratricopeptide repeat protein, partial [Bacteroidota bacterium]